MTASLSTESRRAMEESIRLFRELCHVSRPACDEFLKPIEARLLKLEAGAQLPLFALADA